MQNLKWVLKKSKLGKTPWKSAEIKQTHMNPVKDDAKAQVGTSLITYRF